DRPALLDQLRKFRSVFGRARWIRLQMRFRRLHRTHRNPLANQLLVGRETHLANLGAEIGERSFSLHQRSDDLRVDSFLGIFAIDTNSQAPNAVPDPGQIVRHGSLKTGWIVRVGSRDDPQHSRGIRGTPAHRSDMIERVGQWEDAVPADPAPCWLDAGQAAGCGGKPDRTAGVTSNRAIAKPRRGPDAGTG